MVPVKLLSEQVAVHSGCSQPVNPGQVLYTFSQRDAHHAATALSKSTPIGRLRRAEQDDLIG